MCLNKNLYKDSLIKRYDDDGIVPMFSYEDFKGLFKEDVSFYTFDNLVVKGAFYYYKNYKKDKLVVFCHGLGAGHRAYMREIEVLCKNGYRVLSYDNIGCWESEGKTIRGLTESLYDLDCCLSFIEKSKELKDLDIYLIGHSWGGYAVGNILNFRSKNVKGVCVISGFCSVEDYYRFATKTEKDFKYMMKWEKRAHKKYVDSSSANALCNARAKVLIIHSKDDELVPISIGAEKLLGLNGKINFLIEDFKHHNPNYTKNASDCLIKCFGEYTRLLGENKLPTLKDKQDFMNTHDFFEMTEQDESVWNKISEIIK